jgi:hypothetical protein
MYLGIHRFFSALVGDYCVSNPTISMAEGLVLSSHRMISRLVNFDIGVVAST